MHYFFRCEICLNTTEFFLSWPPWLELWFSASPSPAGKTWSFLPGEHIIQFNHNHSLGLDVPKVICLGRKLTSCVLSLPDPQFPQGPGVAEALITLGAFVSVLYVGQKFLSHSSSTRGPWDDVGVLASLVLIAGGAAWAIRHIEKSWKIRSSESWVCAWSHANGETLYNRHLKRFICGEQQGQNKLWYWWNSLMELIMEYELMIYLREVSSLFKVVHLNQEKRKGWKLRVHLN